MKCLPSISLDVTKLNLIIFILTTETKRRRGLGRLVYASSSRIGLDRLV